MNIMSKNINIFNELTKWDVKRTLIFTGILEEEGVRFICTVAESTDGERFVFIPGYFLSAKGQEYCVEPIKNKKDQKAIAEIFKRQKLEFKHLQIRF